LITKPTVKIPVKHEVVREERFAGSQRRRINQHRSGVVSGFKLRDILKMRSQHLMTEKFYVQLE
jgi:hypothetical protein